MSTMMTREHGLSEQLFICDHSDCGASATATEIIAGGGMSKLGWARIFNEDKRQFDHYCPQHSLKEV